MIDIKRLKDIFSKDKLSKINSYISKSKTLLEKIKNWIHTSTAAAIKFLRNLGQDIMLFFRNVKSSFSKDNLKRAWSFLRSFFNKKNFTKEKLKERAVKIKDSFSRENIKAKLASFKTSFSENKKEYLTFTFIGLFLIAGLYISVRQGVLKTKPVSQKYVIATNKAEEYFYNREYDKSVEEYNSIKEKDAANGMWDAKIAEVYSVKGDMDNSKIYLQKAKELGAKNGEVINYVIFTEFMNKDYNSALQDGEEALNQFTGQKSLIKTMFTVYMANNELDKAKELIASYPVDAKSAFDTAEYARMLMIAGQWDDGYKELKSAWDIDKDEYKIYDVLAQISVYNKDLLLENVTTLADKYPNDLAYKMWLAKIYSLDSAAADQANELVNTLKTENVGKIEVKLIEASVLQNLNQTAKADELIQNVIEENKEDYRVLHTAGWYYLNKKELYNAEQYCRESIIKNKDYTDNYGFLMPEILKAEGKGVEGEPYFRTAMFKEPYNYNIMLTIANYYWYTTKNSDKATEYFKFAEIVKPEEPEIKYNRALIDIANNKIDDAVNLLKECIKLSDSTAKYHRTLGALYLLNNNPQEAIKEIRYAYGSDQEDIMTLNNAGCYYISQEVNFDRGLYNLQKAEEGINNSTDKYTADTIKENYKKAKDLYNQYNSGKANSTLKMPEFVLFY